MKITDLTTFILPPRWCVVDEARVRAAAETGHSWRNPVCRHRDGRVAEW